jgi:uncharacterized protein (TIGR02453 family)
MSVSQRSFTPELFRFLRELRENNDRDWFAANKERYEDVAREPALEFVSDFTPYLDEISPHFRADPRPVGGSLFRIHRDTRFSKDKSPYKTHIGIHFRHEQAKDAHAPGFYLHLQPREVFAAVGIWHPDTPTLGRIREAIDKDPDGWRAVTTRKPFAGLYRLTGDSLKRPPAGYDAAHPLIEDLKRKDYVAVTQLEEGDVTRTGFVARYAETCRAATPFVEFLCRGIDVPF